MSNQLSDITLKTLRTQHGLSQAQVARLTGNTQQQMSRLEQGSELPSLPTAARLAALLHTPVDALFPALFARARLQTERRLQAFNRTRRQPYVPSPDTLTVLALYPSIRRLGRAVFEAPAPGG